MHRSSAAFEPEMESVGSLGCQLRANCNAVIERSFVASKLRTQHGSRTQRATTTAQRASGNTPAPNLSLNVTRRALQLNTAMLFTTSQLLNGPASAREVWSLRSKVLAFNQAHNLVTGVMGEPRKSWARISRAHLPESVTPQ